MQPSLSTTTPSQQNFDLDNPFLTPGSDYPPDFSYQQDTHPQSSLATTNSKQQPFEPEYSFTPQSSDLLPDLFYHQNTELQPEILDQLDPTKQAFEPKTPLSLKAPTFFLISFTTRIKISKPSLWKLSLPVSSPLSLIIPLPYKAPIFSLIPFTSRTRIFKPSLWTHELPANSSSSLNNLFTSQSSDLPPDLPLTSLSSRPAMNKSSPRTQRNQQ